MLFREDKGYFVGGPRFSELLICASRLRISSTRKYWNEYLLLKSLRQRVFSYFVSPSVTLGSEMRLISRAGISSLQCDKITTQRRSKSSL